MKKYIKTLLFIIKRSSLNLLASSALFFASLSLNQRCLFVLFEYKIPQNSIKKGNTNEY
ncbi:hypothetical protein [Eubacterium sp.]